MTRPLLQRTDRGLYCEVGDFFIDPWRPVDRAVVTHAHSDHARWGSNRYLAAKEGEHVFRSRLGDDAEIRFVDWGETVDRNGVSVSLHPAGHILGSAQVRVEHQGEVWVVTGDYKTEPDPTCRAFELVRCDVLITESTFGLPIYRWSPQRVVFDEINAWWRGNVEAGRTSLLLGYALGKSQRMLAGVDPTIGTIYCHGAVERLNAAYRASGIELPETHPATIEKKGKIAPGALVVAPPSAWGSTWVNRFPDVSAAFASGWMRIRGTRRRRSVDRGFVLSDHVDWPSLMDVIDASGARRVLVTHGYSETVVRVLRQRGLDADRLETAYGTDEEDTSDSQE